MPNKQEPTKIKQDTLEDLSIVELVRIIAEQQREMDRLYLELKQRKHKQLMNQLKENNNEPSL